MLVMHISEIIYSFILGAIVALIVFGAHIIAAAIKRECQDVGVHARCIEARDPVLYMLLYRAKQHAVRSRAIAPGKGLKHRLLSFYSSFQPDSRYLRLERNISKLTDPEVKLTKEKIVAVLSRCNKDVLFLDDAPRHVQPRNFIITMMLCVISRLVLPERDGPLEPANAVVREEVKQKLSDWLHKYALKENLIEPHHFSSTPLLP